MREHALAAKMIRKELKEAFPTIAFSVRSSIYSGGSSVYIEWENGPTVDSVRRLADKYQYGHFDGMYDIYENTNMRKDIPQVKFVQMRRSILENIKQQVFVWLQKTHMHFKEVFSMDECNDNLNKMWSVWTARDYIYRILVKEDLTNGFKIPSEEVL